MGFMTGVWRLLGAAEEEPEYEQTLEYPGPATRSGRHEAHDPQQRIIDMPRTAAAEHTTMCIFRPQMEGAGQPGFSMKAYAGQLLDRRAVLVDVNDLANDDLDEATRVIDYLSGVAEAVSGSVYEVAKNIFIFAPSNIALEGDPLKQVEVY
jgi:FtsZ-interacting cell division protein YlmF